MHIIWKYMTDRSLKMLCVVFLSSTLYALCVETKINFVNQNKGKITLVIFPWNRESLAMSWRSGFFRLKMVANKKAKIPWEYKSIQFVMVNAIPWSVLMPSTKCKGLSYPPTSWKVGVVLLGILFLDTDLNKPHFCTTKWFLCIVCHK